MHCCITSKYTVYTEYFLQFVNELLAQGEITRDFGVRQETVKIGKGSY